LITGACGAARNSVNTASVCFRTIGVAAAAAGDHGRMIGVDHRGPATLRNLFPHDPIPQHSMCVVGFARHPAPGAIIVIVDPRDRRIVGVHNVDKSPIRFRDLS
jgi:hypothetical protein